MQRCSLMTARPARMRMASVGQCRRQVVQPVQRDASRNTECSYVFIAILLCGNFRQAVRFTRMVMQVPTPT